MSSFVTPYADMLGILEALYTITKDRWERWGKPNSRNDGWSVQDGRTIGIFAGRQCGVTKASLQWIRKHPGKCIQITKDTKLSECNLANYVDIEGGQPDDYVRLVQRYQPDMIVSWMNTMTPEQIESTRFIILDDSVFLFNGGSFKRATFNNWVADTFHPDTFVILIK